MVRASLILTALTATAAAQLPPSSIPATGDALPPNGHATWSGLKLQWLYDVPSFTDAAGKIVVHWFCTPRVGTCGDDLGRVIALKEQNPRVYIVAYVNGTKADAKKLDPIRESEGVGRGTVAFGPDAMALFKKLGIVGPASFVVDIDGKIALAALGGGPADLDARDAKVKALANAVKEHTSVVEAPRTIKAGEKFQLTLKIQLANWLRFSKRGSLDFKLTTLPKDIKCDASALSAAQLKLADQTLTAQVSCSGPHGSYEVRGQINFAYDTLAGAAGMGTDGATWKFEITK